MGCWLNKAYEAGRSGDNSELEALTVGVPGTPQLREHGITIEVIHQPAVAYLYQMRDNYKNRTSDWLFHERDREPIINRSSGSRHQPPVGLDEVDLE